MKNQITLNEEAIKTLRSLIGEIDANEGNEEECDADVVVENLYKVCDIVREAIANDEEAKPTFPTVILKLHLYDLDENENPIPMNDDDVCDCVANIISSDDVNGYTITDYEVIEDTLPRH